MTYLSPEDTKVDEQMSLLWDVVVPGQGPPETVIMGDILGDAADEEKVCASTICSLSSASRLVGLHKAQEGLNVRRKAGADGLACHAGARGGI